MGNKHTAVVALEGGMKTNKVHTWKYGSILIREGNEYEKKKEKNTQTRCSTKLLFMIFLSFN